MTEAEVIEALSQHWRDNWPTLSPVPFTFDNEVGDGAEQYVRVSFAPLTRTQATMGTEGARKFQMRGVIFVQLFGLHSYLQATADSGYTTVTTNSGQQIRVKNSALSPGQPSPAGDAPPPGRA